MSKPGQYMGGIRGLKELRDRCYIDPDTGCWSYRPKGRESKQVCIHGLRDPSGGMGKMPVRRAALFLRDGEIPEGHGVVWARPVCKSDHCANPSHSRSGTRKEWGKWLAETGAAKASAAKVAANMRTNRSRRKLTPEKVAYAKSSSKPVAALARECGVSKSVMQGVIKGTTYRDHHRAASVFSWDGA